MEKMAVLLFHATARLIYFLPMFVRLMQVERIVVEILVVIMMETAVDYVET